MIFDDFFVDVVLCIVDCLVEVDVVVNSVVVVGEVVVLLLDLFG